MKLVYFLAGLYVWEFIMYLDYEYSIVRGRRKFLWTSLFYVGCRWCTLAALIIQLVGFDSSYGINCQVLVAMTFLFACLSFLFASSLVILRVHTLWEYNRTVVGITFALLLANTGSFIYNAAISRGRWAGDMCQIDHLVDTRASILSTFTADLILLALKLVGILRWKEARQKVGTWRLLYSEGLTWVVVFTLANVPPVVFIILNLNDPMNRMFIVPGMIVMSIGAVRMHRGITDRVALCGHQSEIVDTEKQSIQTTIQFLSSSHASHNEGGTHGTGGGVFASLHLAMPEVKWFGGKRDDGSESSGKETV